MVDPSPECRSGIYAITHVASGRQYIGSAVYLPSRWAQHRMDLRRGTHHSRHLQRAWAKYGPDAFTFAVLEYVPDRTMLVEREQFYIDQRFQAKGWHEFNMAPRAGSTLGVTLSPETRAKLSASLRGRKLSPEHRAKMLGRKPNPAQLAGLAKGWAAPRTFVMTAVRAAYYRRRRGQPAHPNSLRGLEGGRGRPLTPEQRDALLEASARMRRGKPLSTEHRAKIGDGNRGRAYSDEQLAGIKAVADARRGKPMSESHRAALKAAWEHRRLKPMSEKQKAMYERQRGRSINERQRAGLSKGWHAARTDRQIEACRENLGNTATHRKHHQPPYQPSLFD